MTTQLSTDYFTIEPAPGRHPEGTEVFVYAHGTYGETSALAGQSGRRFVESYETVRAAKEAYPDAEVLTRWSSRSWRY